MCIVQNYGLIARLVRLSLSPSAKISTFYQAVNTVWRQIGCLRGVSRRTVTPWLLFDCQRPSDNLSYESTPRSYGISARADVFINLIHIFAASRHRILECVDHGACCYAGTTIARRGIRTTCLLINIFQLSRLTIGAN